MMRQSSEDAPSVDPSTQQRLTHALAFESRNALSRVELAASELARFDATPRMREMIGTIHEAVAEIDSLLGTIGALCAPASDSDFDVQDAGDLGEALPEALSRVESILLARGVVLEVLPWRERPLPSEIPVPTLTRLLFAFLRLGLALSDRGDAVRLEGIADAKEVGLEWRTARGFAGDRSEEAMASLGLEIEAQWAEWGGRIRFEDGAGVLRLILPRIQGEGGRQDA